MKHGIIIPCYNESSRLELDSFIDFANQNKDYTLCLVNDGSGDMTRSTLARVKNVAHENVLVYHMEDNQGKANAVRLGALFMYRETNVETIGFLDADLSTTFQDYDQLVSEMEKSRYNLKVIFGSRNMEGTEGIERNPLRKLVSMIICSLIHFITKLDIDDTQCGAKVFHRSLIPLIYTQPFFSRWLFDVEILLRLKTSVGKPSFLNMFMEKPLDKWVHMDGSKISLKDSIMIPLNLLNIWKEYNLKQWMMRAKAKLITVFNNMRIQIAHSVK